MTERWRWQGRTLVLRVHASPRARRDGILGWYGDALKVRVAAPPARGEANARLKAILSEAFGVPVASVTLAAGAGGRLKRVRIRAPRRFPACFGDAVAAGRPSN